MRNARGLIFYLFLSLIFLLGVFLPKERKADGSNEFTTIPTEKVAAATIKQSEPPFITSEIKAKPVTQFSKGVIITGQGDNLLVLINKHIRLPETYEPADLVPIDGKIAVTRLGMRLRAGAADALAQMAAAAKNEGANLIVTSAYRSYWEQQATFSHWAKVAGLTAAENFSARPGHSQHQLGTAVDFTSESVGRNLTADFAKVGEGSWLAKNAYEFGFVLSYPQGKEAVTGYIYEPWHYRYIGVENAHKMVESDLILEEFLQRFGVV